MLRAIAFWLLLLTAPLAAQDQKAILIIDLERAFKSSLYGQRVAAEIQATGAALLEENEKIVADLEAEEQDLSRRRPDMAPEAFRAEADGFDARVMKIRREQDAKEAALLQVQTRGQQRFLVAAQPALQQMMEERGASVVLSSSGLSILAVAEGVDVTDLAVAAIDAAIGDGSE